MAPRKQRPDPARENEYVCRRSERDSEGQLIVCGKVVPPGELPYLAYNTVMGSYPVLCLECRKDLERVLLPFLGASWGEAQLLSSLVKLPIGQLVSEAQLRLVLKEAGRSPRRSGPLSTEQKLEAIEIWFGPAMAAELEEMWDQEGAGR